MKAFRQHRLKPGALGTVDMEYKDKNDMVCAGCQGQKSPSLGIQAQRAKLGALGTVDMEYKDKKDMVCIAWGFQPLWGGLVLFYAWEGSAGVLEGIETEGVG